MSLWQKLTSIIRRFHQKTLNVALEKSMLNIWDIGTILQKQMIYKVFYIIYGEN